MTIANANRWSELNDATPPRKAARRPAADDPTKLSARHLDILRCLANGLTDAQIGAQLGIAGGTVAAHLVEIYRRMGARNRPHAVALGFRRGLLTIENVR